MALCVVTAGAFTVSAACASSPDAGATVASMDTFGVELAKVKDSIDGTVKALEAVVGTEASEIRVNFATYTKSVAALDRQANVVRKRAEEMRALGDEFFKEWEPPKNVSPERRAELTASYAKIQEDTTLAKDQFAPFLKALKDIESYLELDLSPTGINSMGELTKKAKENGAKVKTSIDAALVQVNSVRGMVSTK
jgi:hypothetical protein